MKKRLLVLALILVALPYPVWYYGNWYAAGLANQVELIEFNMEDDFYYCNKWRPELLNKDAKITYYVADKGNWSKGTLISNNVHYWSYVYVTPDPRIPIFNVSHLDQSIRFSKKKPISIPPPSTYPKQPVKKEATLFEWLSKYNPELINELNLNK